jgi:non-specific protein-tyrosine kinase
LQTEISDLENFVSGWQVNYAELLAFLQGGESPNLLTIIEPAQLPSTPISPNTPLNVALAAAVAFVLATLAAMVLEYLDDSIKTANDFDSGLGLSVLANIYRMNDYESRDALVTVAEPFSTIAESYRMLRTNLQFSAVDKPRKCIMVTSPGEGEGKSTMVANLAVTMAQADLKTIIVDADLRRPRQHSLFKVSNFTGLSEILCSVEPEIESYLKETGVPNLQLLTAGPLPPNPSELLGSKRMGDLIEHLRQLADIVIFDSVPVLVASDSSVLAARVDGVVLIAWVNRTRQDTAREVIKRLKDVGANILGGVLNGVPEVKGHYGYHNYSYNKSGSGGKTDKSVNRKWWHRLPIPKRLKTIKSFQNKPEQINQK